MLKVQQKKVRINTFPFAVFKLATYLLFLIAVLCGHAADDALRLRSCGLWHGHADAFQRVAMDITLALFVEDALDLFLLQTGLEVLSFLERSGFVDLQPGFPRIYFGTKPSIDFRSVLLIRGWRNELAPSPPREQIKDRSKKKEINQEACHAYILFSSAVRINHFFATRGQTRWVLTPLA